MKHRIITFLGILILVFAVVGFFAFDNTLRQNSDMFGTNMAVLTQNVKEGQIITNTMLMPQKIKNDQKVPDAVEWKNAQSIVGKVALIDMFANEQIIPERLGNKNEVDNNYHYVSFPTSFIDSVAGTLKEGDYVDIWLKPNIDYPAQGYTEPEKLFEGVKILEIKTENDQDINQVPNGIPFVCVVKLTDSQIKILKTFIPDQTSQNTFLTIYPNQLGKSIEAGQ